MERKQLQLPRMTSTPQHCRSTQSLEVAFKEVSPILPDRKAKSLIPVKRPGSILPVSKLSVGNLAKQVTGVSNFFVSNDNAPRVLPQLDTPDKTGASKKCVTFGEDVGLKADDKPSDLLILKSAENSVGTSVWQIPSQAGKPSTLKRKNNRGQSENKRNLSTNAHEVHVGDLFEDIEELCYPAKKRKTFVVIGKNVEDRNVDNNNDNSEKVKNVFDNSENKVSISEPVEMSKKGKTKQPELLENQTHVISSSDVNANSLQTKINKLIPDDTQISRESGQIDSRKTVQLHSDDKVTLNNDSSEVIQNISKNYKINSKVNADTTRSKNKIEELTPHEDTNFQVENNLNLMCTNKIIKYRKGIDVIGKKLKESNFEQLNMNTDSNDETYTIPSQNNNNASSRNAKGSADVASSKATEEIANTEITKQLNIHDKDEELQNSIPKKRQRRQRKCEIFNNITAKNSPPLKLRKRKEKESINCKENFDQKHNDAATFSSKSKRNCSISLFDEVAKHSSIRGDVDSPQSNFKTSNVVSKVKTVEKNTSIIDNELVKVSSATKQSGRKSKKCSGKESVNNKNIEHNIPMKDLHTGLVTLNNSQTVNEQQSPMKPAEKPELARRSKRALKPKRSTKAKKTSSEYFCSKEGGSSNTITKHKIKSELTNSETYSVTLNNSQMVNEQSPMKPPVEKPELARRSKRALKPKRSTKAEKTSSEYVCSKEAGSSNTSTNRKSKSDLINSETCSVARTAEKEVDKIPKREYEQQKDEQNVKKTSVRRRAVSACYISSGETLREQPLVVADQNLKRESGKITSTEQVLEQVSTIQSKSVKKMSSDNPGLILSNQRQNCENTYIHPGDELDRRHISRKVTTPIAYWKNRDSINEKTETNVRKSRKRTIEENGGDQQHKIEMYPESPSPQKINARQCFGQREVKMSEPSPGVLICTQIHINNFVMSGTMYLQAGASIVSASTNTMYFVCQGAACVTICNLSRIVRAEGETNSFFIPKRSVFSIKNEESITLKMEFTKFRG